MALALNYPNKINCLRPSVNLALWKKRRKKILNKQKPSKAVSRSPQGHIIVLHFSRCCFISIYLYILIFFFSHLRIVWVHVPLVTMRRLYNSNKGDIYSYIFQMINFSCSFLFWKKNNITHILSCVILFLYKENCIFTTNSLLLYINILKNCKQLT